MTKLHATIAFHIDTRSTPRFVESAKRCETVHAIGSVKFEHPPRLCSMSTLSRKKDFLSIPNLRKLLASSAPGLLRPDAASICTTHLQGVSTTMVITKYHHAATVLARFQILQPYRFTPQCHSHSAIASSLALRAPAVSLECQRSEASPKGTLICRAWKNPGPICSCQVGQVLL